MVFEKCALYINIGVTNVGITQVKSPTKFTKSGKLFVKNETANTEIVIANLNKSLLVSVQVVFEDSRYHFPGSDNSTY